MRSMPDRFLMPIVLSLLVLFFNGCSESNLPAGGGGGEAVTPQAANVPEATSTEAAPEPEADLDSQPYEVTLPKGTQLVVRTTASISTKTNQPGQSFQAVLEQPIVDGDWVIAKKGALVEGRIIECDPGGRVEGVASLAIGLQRVTLTDGRVIDVHTSAIHRQARSTKKKDAQKIGIGAGIGAAIGAIAGGGKGAAIGAAAGGGAGTGLVLATHGEPAVIPSESKLTFTLTKPVTITR